MIFDLFAAQRVYRQVLDCMARPGKVNLLEGLSFVLPGCFNKSVVAVALTLFDNETSFFIPEERGNSLQEFLRLHTLARVQALEEADFIIVHGPEKRGVSLAKVKRGDLLFPEEGATIIYAVDSLQPGNSAGPARNQKSVTIELQGPGVKDKKSLHVNGIEVSHLKEIQRLNSEFPLGVDVVLGGNDCQVACIPRSSTIVWEVMQ